MNDVRATLLNAEEEIMERRQQIQVRGMAESIPRNRFLGSINVYKYGLSD